ncbi:MAG TPA: heavy-metal-associated domain-containing protein [Saprospiraceae bacterium]
MKHLFFILISLAISTAATAQSKSTEIFKVYGNCGMCKKTIESAAIGTKGVKSASWDMEKDMITVVYDQTKTNVDKIKSAIAESGYDTDTHRAPDKAYENLHGCCQYERPKPN